MNITDNKCPEGYIEQIDFIQATGISIETMQTLIKYHRLDGRCIDNEFYICAYEVDYFKEYFKTHNDIL